jgi:UDP-glucose 4-epimerase
VATGPIGASTDWTKALEGREAVVHLAGRAHVRRDEASDPQGAFDQVNLHGTRRLAEQAVARGVRRFVFLSSVKVNGETTHERPFTEADPPAPQDPYARSKAGAERALAEVASNSTMEVVILRSPLVYGPGVKANFLALLRLAATGLPLPFAAIANRRSFIFVENLADIIVRTMARPPQSGCRTYLVSDGKDLSTPELIAYLRAGMAMQPRLVRIPPEILRGIARLIGGGAVASRLLDCLQVDSTAFQRAYDWRPPTSPQEALISTGHWFVSTRLAHSSKTPT